MFLLLHNALVRPLLEYCSSVWNPLLMRDGVELEKVQRRATKMVEGFKDLEYNERLIGLNLDSLHFRPRRADLIQVFKTVKGIHGIDRSVFFVMTDSARTRGHSLRIRKTQARINMRQNVFSCRCVNDWNCLSEPTVNSSSVNGFKSALEREWYNYPGRFDMP